MAQRPFVLLFEQERRYPAARGLYLSRINLRKHNARILEVTRDYTVIQKTGYKEETQELFEDMNKLKVLQFTRSGRIAITKATRERLSEYLHKLDTQKRMIEI